MENLETNKINEEELRRRALELLAENAQKIAVINRLGGRKVVTDISLTTYSFYSYVHDKENYDFKKFVFYDDNIWNEEEVNAFRQCLDETIDAFRAEVARNRERSDYVEAQLKTIEA